MNTIPPAAGRPSGDVENQTAPLVLKIVIIGITVLALIFAVRMCQRMSDTSGVEHSSSSSPASSAGGGGESGANGGQADTAGSGGSPSPTDTQTETSTAAEPGAGVATAAEEPSSTESPAPGNPASPPGSLAPSAESREIARGIESPSRLTSTTSPSGVTTFEALFREIFLEAKILFALTESHLKPDERAYYANQIESIEKISVYLGPYYQSPIAESAIVSSALTCLLASHLASRPATAEAARSLTPSSQMNYTAGFPTILGDCAEIQIQAWCLLLRDSGKAGNNEAERIEAGLRSLPPKSSMKRSLAALDLCMRTHVAIAKAIPTWKANPGVLQDIEARNQKEANIPTTVFGQHYARQRFKTAGVRYLATGESP